MPGETFFSWPRPYVKEMVNETMKAVFIPFAAVTISYDDYESLIKKAFQELGVALRSIHHEKDFQKALQEADVLVIGGGNTFALLSQLYNYELLNVIRDKVTTGTPFIGWSAGSNVACPTIMTTNDMPIVQPRSFDALGFIPFQINPHYTEFKQPGHGGESRSERIEEFLVMNPGRKVVGLPEGTLLHVTDEKITLKGNAEATLFRAGKSPVLISPGEDLFFPVR